MPGAKAVTSVSPGRVETRVALALPSSSVFTIAKALVILVGPLPPTATMSPTAAGKRLRMNSTRPLSTAPLLPVRLAVSSRWSFMQLHASAGASITAVGGWSCSVMESAELVAVVMLIRPIARMISPITGQTSRFVLSIESPRCSLCRPARSRRKSSYQGNPSIVGV